MEYATVREQFDRAYDAQRTAADRFGGLFPPRNTPIHLGTPGLNHDRLRDFYDELEGALSAYREAASRLKDVALRECPDVLVG